MIGIYAAYAATRADLPTGKKPCAVTHKGRREMIITLLTLFLVLCIVGLIVWGIGQVPGIPPIIKVVIYVVVGVLVLLWLLGEVQSGGFHFGLR
jgi:Flp pilus assembly protein TadB